MAIGIILKIDDQGGVVPQNLVVAESVDLITLPKGITGTNCENCKFEHSRNGKGYCTHPSVKQYVNENNCCALWDANGVIRAWKKKK